ncbi:MAG: alkaline phosphatase family protein [Crenarchaeota archaeon]|nr:alkaline phosphatase family protein [Thermoproteota archaeon]
MLNIKNILPQIASIFGEGIPNYSTLSNDCLADLKGIKKVLLIIFDGLGYNRLLHHINNHRSTFTELAKQGVLKPITTVFPSTTSSALTSIFSGLPPAQHQIIGYRMFSKKYGTIYNTLDMKPVYEYSSKIELAKDYAHSIKLLIPLLEQRGIQISVITKSKIIGSGLSQITHQNIMPTPYILSSDMWTHATAALENPSNQLSITYYSGVDSLAHKYGNYSKEVTFELTSIENNLQEFISGLSKTVKEETLLIITADHGIADVKQSIYLKDYPEIMQHLLLPPVGDGRATYLFCKSHKKAEFQKTFEKTMTGFKLFPTEELVQKGVFGEPINREELKEKLGDFTVLSNSDKILDYPFFDDDRQYPQVGAHGGMSEEEMVIPILSARLSEL